MRISNTGRRLYMYKRGSDMVAASLLIPHASKAVAATTGVSTEADNAKLQFARGIQNDRMRAMYMSHRVSGGA